MLEYHPMVNLPGTRPFPTTARTIPAGQALLLSALLAITLASCGSDSAPQGSAGGEAAGQFELVDRAGKTYLLTDLYSCAPLNKTTGDQRCDYREFYLLSGGVHYRFDWDGIRSLERQSQSPGDMFKLTLKGGQSLVGTFDRPPFDAKGSPVGPADALSATLVEMSGNTATFPVSVIANLQRRSTH